MTDSYNSDSAPDQLGPLFQAEHSAHLERADRNNPIPGGEPPCPVCGAKLVRFVEEHGPQTTEGSPFRVRLVCCNDECRRWTVYTW